jgi:hypothetical protein
LTSGSGSLIRGRVTAPMPARLVPCPVCACHVRTTEESCPFCRSAVPSWLGGLVAPEPPTQRLGRAGLYAYGKAAASRAAFGAAMLAAAACDSQPSSAPATTPVDNTSGAQAQVSVYGAPPPQLPSRAADASSGAVDAGLGQAQINGGPPPRAVPSPGVAVPAYGAPPPARSAVPPAKP